MIDAMLASPLFGIVLSIGAFQAGKWVQKKTKIAVCNPLVIAIVLCIGVLALLRIPLETYARGGDIIQLLLAPATAVLALNIYNQLPVLKKHFLPVLVGCTAGSVTSILSVMGLCKLFGLTDDLTAALVPKSCTTPIAISIAQSRGGLVPIAVVAVLITGLIGTVCAPFFAKFFGIRAPVAEGLAVGACSHALGTAKALELGEIQGAMSSIAIGVCGMITVVLCLFL